MSALRAVIGPGDGGFNPPRPLGYTINGIGRIAISSLLL
jgi:hypothetical protein